MITKEQYDQAIAGKNKAEEIIKAFHKEQQDNFDARMRDNPIFTDDELFYSAVTLCPCGHGLAYPNNCGAFHYWDCSAILKGVADVNVKHTAKLPFISYDIKGESEQRGTSRGVFKLQVQEAS